MIREAIALAAERRDLPPEVADAAMRELMEGAATPAQVAAFLVALRMKGETAAELLAFARVMREKCTRIHPANGSPVVDLCGTGGAPLKTFNISTVASLVVAAAGVRVAKHGNRSFTSACGSADLLEALGVRIDLEPPEARRVLEEVGMCFLFAPKFHPAMRHVALPRKEVGLRTVFNILGPLTNPAGASAQLMGVFSPSLVGTVPEVMRGLGVERALVVHNELGADEILPTGRTFVGELEDGEVRRSVLRVEELGLEPTRPEDVANVPPPEAARRALAVLRGEDGGLSDTVAINAAAGLLVAGRVARLDEGMEIARDLLDGGRALELLRRLATATGGDLTILEG
ncbi:MAG TPA: anthranilate phosphoribosyltransferase [Thermoplasmata archaeon]|nr:anthranilate phosphoribosyltransferase [Thermoplasmata archaeon]